MNDENGSETKDLWRILESVAKLLGGIGAVLGAVLIPLYLHNQTQEANRRAAEDRKVQVYAQIMSQREAKDTEIRAKMFETLLSQYIEKLGPDNPGSALPVEGDPKGYSVRRFNEKLIFLGILMENFLEYFSAGPLFQDLYAQICDAEKASRASGGSEDVRRLSELRTKLIKMCKYFAGKEITMLSRMGLVSGRIAVREGCESGFYIPLFDIESRDADAIYPVLEDPETNRLCEQDSTAGSGAEPAPSPFEPEALQSRDSFLSTRLKDDSTHYAISIKVREIAYPEVGVSISLFRCVRNRNLVEFIPVRKEPFVFSVSYFDMPYMDNTRLFEGQRFAIVLKSICSEETRNMPDEHRACVKPGSYPYAVFQVVTFKEEFMSLRDRPLFEDMLNKLKAQGD